MNKKQFTKAMRVVFKYTIDFKNSESFCTCPMIAHNVSSIALFEYREFLKKCLRNNIDPINKSLPSLLIKKRFASPNKTQRQQILVLRAIALTMFWQECLETKAYLNF